MPLLAKSVLLTLVLTVTSAQVNPFSGRSVPAEPAVAAPLPFFESLRQIQRELHRTMVETMNQAQQSLLFWPLLFLVTFGYGILHSLLPGHQKGLVVGYLMNRREGPPEALILGILMATAHFLSSLLLYLAMMLLQYLAVGALSLIESQALVTRIFSSISALGILVLAVFLVRESWHHLQQLRRQKALQEVTKILDIPTNETGPRVQNRHLRGVLFVSAMVPCPGTMLVLLFAFSLGAHGLGLLSILGISLGNGVLIGTLALLTILARKNGEALASQHGLEIAAVFIQLGTVLLLALSAVSILTI